MGYTRTAIKGVSWLTSVRVITRALSFAKTLVVARLLTPSQFGLFGIATLVLAFIEVMTETGVNIFLVQQKDNINKYLGTALSVSIIRGTCIALLIVVAAPFVASFFDAPSASTILYTMALVPFLRGFINPAVVRFQKDLLFHKEFILRTCVIVVEIITTIALLFVFKKPIALVWGILVGVATEVALSYLLISPRPMVAWNNEYFKKLFHTGKWITTAGIFNYGFERGDDIFVGRILGTGALGAYDMAYRISLLPITELVDMVTRVVFPVYVRISGDYARLKRAYFRTIGVVAAIVTPFGIGVFIFAEQIVRLLLGNAWEAAIPVLQVLAILSVVRAVSLSVEALLLALKLQKQVTVTTIVAFGVMAALIFPLISMYGLTGAALAALFGYIASVPFIVYYSLNALASIKKNTSTVQ